MQIDEKQLRQIIDDTAAKTAAIMVVKLKISGLLRDGQRNAVQKTDALLRHYNDLREVDEPFARKIVANIDACMAAAENDPYLDAVRLYYFGGLTDEAVADMMVRDTKTVWRNRKRLVKHFSARLAFDDFIRELLL